MLEGHPSYTNDTEQRNKNLCDVVHYLFKKYDLLPDRSITFSIKKLIEMEKV